MRLLLIRHAQTIDNVNGELGTLVPGPPLTELGVSQAAAIPGALDAQPIAGIYVSTMQRTRLTAEPLARSRGLSIVELDGLREITAGDLEARSDKESIRTYMGTIFSWWQNFDSRIPGGEDGNEFYARFTGAVETAYADHGSDATVAIFSHGAAIRTWASWSSANLDAEFSRTHPLENTAVVVVEGSPAEGWLTTYWAGEPAGGAALEDATAVDPTGEAG
jgi:broad specificity phosphatase PhoE